MDVVCKNLIGISILLKWMKQEGNSSNSRSFLNDIKIKAMMMRMTLKLVPLVIIRRVLILFIIDHTKWESL
jgi:hypothetical protein